VINLGLAGLAGCGKDSVADYLVRTYGFIKYSFSDALYREVVDAFGLDSEDLLRDRESKEKALACLRLEYCQDHDFVTVAKAALNKEGGITLPHVLKPLSPRWVLQVWGTQYRRAQDPDYWVLKAQDWVTSVRRSVAFLEQKPQFFVNTSTRFSNERAWIHATRWDGNVWHLHRDGIQPVHAHESETPLPVFDGERELWNNAGLDQLYRGVDLLLSTNAQFVKCEPMKPMTEPEEQS
jgi:hypothetical protein